MNDQTVQNPYAPPQATVRDIVDPSRQAEPADRITRLGAAFLDTIMGMAIMAVPMILGALIIVFGSADGSDSPNPLALVGGGLVMAIGAAVWGWLTYINVKRTGQTLGKKALKIKVVRVDGSPASVGRIFWLRNVVNGLIGAIPILGSIYGLVDHLFIFSDTRQCLHDKLADTIVVKA